MNIITPVAAAWEKRVYVSLEPPNCFVPISVRNHAPMPRKDNNIMSRMPMRGKIPSGGITSNKDIKRLPTSGAARRSNHGRLTAIDCFGPKTERIVWPIKVELIATPISTKNWSAASETVARGTPISLAKRARARVVNRRQEIKPVHKLFQ